MDPRAKRILVIGDIILDHFVYGRVERLNPEGPNPLLRVTKDEFKLGGAANVAANISRLGGTVSLFGAVGQDAFAKDIRSLSAHYDIDTAFVERSEPTIVKQRFIEMTYHQQLLRVDRETKHPLSADEVRAAVEHVRAYAPDFIVISDYTKGVITPELMNALSEFRPTMLADAKPENVAIFSDTLVIKPNFREFCKMVGIEGAENTDETIERHGPAFAKKMNSNLIVTRSEKGASLVEKTGTVRHIAPNAQAVFDVTGAGDTFIAGIAVALSEGKTLEEAVRFGNAASAVAVSKLGTAVVERKEVK